MTAQSWFRFYPSDWLGDVKLRQCSSAARGLWIDLICIMHEAKPYGHLLIDGKPPSYYRIAQVVGISPHLAKSLMTQLIETGVFASDTASVFYSKRMVRDKLKSEAGQEFAKRRWGEKPIAPDTRKKERGQPKQKYPPNKQSFRRARHRWENELLAQLGPDEFANTLEVLVANPTLVTRATNAELREPGSGVMAAMLGLRQLNGGSL